MDGEIEYLAQGTAARKTWDEEGVSGLVTTEPRVDQSPPALPQRRPGGRDFRRSGPQRQTEVASLWLMEQQACWGLCWTHRPDDLYELPHGQLRFRRGLPLGLSPCALQT